MTDKRIRVPYKNKRPSLATIYADIGLCAAMIKKAERAGSVHARDRAQRRLRQLKEIACQCESRTCVACGATFETAWGRKAHSALHCKADN